jgi:hypothetical protein
VAIVCFVVDRHSDQHQKQANRCLPAVGIRTVLEVLGNYETVGVIQLVGTKKYADSGVYQWPKRY